MRCFRCVVYLAALLAVAADAQETKPAADPAAVKLGHSLHGEVFNEGPRQKAYLMAGMPQINFPVTTKNEEAQKFFNQGVGQLHGFWYYEAERSFRQAAALDGDLAIAYWGMAMANISNDKRGKGFIAEAVKRKDKAGDREKMYIDALDAWFKADGNKRKERAQAFAKSFERILYQFPDDVEAKAFLALHLWKADGDGVKIESHLAVDAILDQVFAASPMHPAHHYRIHLWDSERPSKALGSAALCGQTSGGIAHLWHMPGHTFSNLKRYDDACWQQEASARVDHAHMMRDRVLPDQIHNFAHNNEWCIRNMIHIGRVRDAVSLAKNMTELPRHPSYNTLARGGSGKLGRERLIAALTEFELWDELIALGDTPYLNPTQQEPEQIGRVRALGTAYFRSGKPTQGEQLLVHARRNLESLQSQQQEAGSVAEKKARDEKKDDKQITQARDQARNAFGGKVNDWQKTVDTLSGHAAVASGDYKRGRELLQKAGADGGYLAWLQLLAGEKDQAIAAAANHASSNVNEVLPLARQVELLWKAEKREEAKAALDKLREISRSIDLQSHVFARVTPIAKELGYPEDWRVIKPMPADAGVRPDLATLGPVRWEPSPAASFALKTAEGQEVSLNNYRGRPVVLIFFLGHGCLHCAQQLHAFAPLKEKFAAAGIDILAISSDDADGLRKSIENYTSGPLPLPLASDPALETFKAYRCFDDFEQKPLHGTFFVDGEGRVRWQDIGFDPFMDPSFVLTEAQRLLALHK
jgi:peroxiredoxin